MIENSGQTIDGRVGTEESKSVLLRMIQYCNHFSRVRIGRSNDG